MVVAAGNDGRNLNLNPEGYGTIDAPGNDPYALTVGAMRTMETPAINDDLIASYSSKGPSFIDHVVKPDIVAPGNLVTSLQYSGDSLAIDNPSFFTLYSFMKRMDRKRLRSSTSRSAAPAWLQPSQAAQFGSSAGGASTHSRQSEGADHGERQSPVLSGDQQRDRHRDHLHGELRHLHDRRGYLDIGKTVSAALVNGGSVPSGTAMSPIAVYNSTTEQTAATVDLSALWTLSGPWSALKCLREQSFHCLRPRLDCPLGQELHLGRQRPRWLHCALGERRLSGARVRRRPRRPCGANLGMQDNQWDFEY